MNQFIWVILLPFLLNFTISIKEMWYHHLAYNQDAKHLGAVSRSCINYTLTAGLALAGFGLIAPTYPDAQALGLLTLGWGGWVLGLTRSRDGDWSRIMNSSYNSLPVRLLVVGLILGACFGAYGGILVALIIGILAWVTSFGGKYKPSKYIEEITLAVSIAALLVIVILAEKLPASDLWQYLRMDVARVDVTCNLTQTFGPVLKELESAWIILCG